MTDVERRLLMLLAEAVAGMTMSPFEEGAMLSRPNGHSRLSRMSVVNMIHDLQTLLAAEDYVREIRALYDAHTKKEPPNV